MPVHGPQVIGVPTGRGGFLRRLGQSREDAALVGRAGCAPALPELLQLPLEAAQFLDALGDMSKRTYAVLWQNIMLALGIKFVFLLLALFDNATMWMAVFADMGASLLVVFNGLRLLNGGRDVA